MKNTENTVKFTLSGLREELGTLFRSPLQSAALPPLVAVLMLTLVGLAVYKIYEHEITSGAGFVRASDVAGLDDVSIDEKKQRFFDVLRPIVQAENTRISTLRKRIIKARDNGEDPSWIPLVAQTYGLTWTGHEWSALLRRVDTVPLTLTMAQAANESSWGQSRFAQEGNNLFGEWCFSKGCGIVPDSRDPGDIHEVRKFETMNDSVRAYLLNINTHAAYRELRTLRANARKAGEPASGMDLAATLSRYSERGMAYVKDILDTIKTNRKLMLHGDDSFTEAKTSE